MSATKWKEKGVPASGTSGSAADNELLSKIKEAVAVVDAAKAEHISRSKELGSLLLEAKKRHPAVKDFEQFIKPVVGLGLSRAYDLMKLAGGRVTEAELRKGARDRQAKSRTKKKKSSQPQLPPPQPSAATFRDVTETAKADQPSAEVKAKSAKALAEFQTACRTYWPGITVEADQQKARAFIDQLMNPKAEAA